jgi:PAS domain S-box-containing protein
VISANNNRVQNHYAIVILQCILGILLLVSLYLVSLYNYLLFHGIVELVGIAIAFSIFILVWNTRKVLPDAFFLIIGISLLFTGSLDLIHTLAFKGMGVFAGNNADLPTQLWIAARYFQCVALLVATLFIGRSITKDRKYDADIVFVMCGAAFLLLLSSIFYWQNFPPCFIEGSGLTAFKIISEYIICLVLAAAILVIVVKRRYFDPGVWRLLVLSLGFLILGELAFTSYVSVYGFMNMLGHLFRLVSVYLFYRAIVVVGLTRPYDLLFRDLKQNQEALEKSERRYAMTLDAVNDGLWDWNIPTGDAFFSDHYYTLLGYEPGEFPANYETWLTLVHPEDTGNVEEKLRSYISSGSGFEIDLRMKMKSGEWKWVSTRGMVVEKDSGGTPTRMVGTLSDITERKKEEQHVQESEEKFREIFNSANDGIHLHEITENGLPGKYVDVNDVVCRMLQYTKEELLRKNPLDISTDYHSKPLDQIGKELLEKGHSVFETGHRRKDGTIIPVEINAHIITIQGKKLILAIARDITRRKRDETALKALSTDLKAIIDNATAMIWYKDTKNNFIRVNPAGAKAFGMPIADIEGKSAFDLFPDMAETYYKDDLEVINSGLPKLDIIEQMHTAHGGVLWVQTDKIPLKDEKGNVTGILVFVVDITERKMAEDALALASKKLNLMSSITRHDILNQLTVLIGFIELSEQLETDPKLMDYLKREKKAAENIHRQITFTRDYQDMGVKEPAWQNISEIIGKVVSELQPRNVKVEVDRTDCEIFADPLFEKVFFNLIENALKYGGDSLNSIVISSENVESGLRIIIEDNGAGISAEDKKHIFTRGFGKHTGLGLFLSREILAITGMTIRETGITGKGARFEILVPKGAYRFNSQ